MVSLKLPSILGQRTPDGLEGRDPEFIRRMLPRFWLAAQLYFRAEVDGLRQRARTSQCSSWETTAAARASRDSFVFNLAYHTYFTVEGRPLIGLAHEVITKAPVVGDFARKFGIVAAGPGQGIRAAGAKVRTSSSTRVVTSRRCARTRDRHTIMFDGRKGFLKLAHANRVKIVPVVATGGQETLFIFNDGRAMARMLGLDRLLRVKSLPLTFSLPWGFLPGGLPNIPFPAKIRIQVLPPIDVHDLFGDEPDWDQAYDYVVSVMQVALSKLAAKQTMPVLG